MVSELYWPMNVLCLKGDAVMEALRAWHMPMGECRPGGEHHGQLRRWRDMPAGKKASSFSRKREEGIHIIAICNIDMIFFR